MSLYLGIAIAFAISIMIGFLIGKKSKDNPIGTLILNESDNTKEYFEFHFTEDLDTFKDKPRVSFYLFKR